MPIEIRENISEGLGRLPRQFDDSILLQNYLSTYLQGIEDVTALANDLLVGVRINNAIGVQLDYIGQLVGERRIGRGDEDYRVAIKTRIVLNNGTATPSDVVVAAKAVAGTEEVGYWEHYPASVIVSVGNESFSTIPNDVAEILDRAAPTGCSLDQVLIDSDGEGLIFAEQLFEEGVIVLDEDSNLVTNLGDFVGYQTVTNLTTSGGNSVFAEIAQNDLVVDQTYLNEPLEVTGGNLIVNGELYQTGAVTFSLNGADWIVTEQLPDVTTGNIYFEVLNR